MKWERQMTHDVMINGMNALGVMAVIGVAGLAVFGTMLLKKEIDKRRR